MLGFLKLLASYWCVFYDHRFDDTDRIIRNIELLIRNVFEIPSWLQIQFFKHANPKWKDDNGNLSLTLRIFCQVSSTMSSDF